MDEALREMMIRVCDEKMTKKGDDVGLSFYAFFTNKNNNPKLLMQAATWWIEIQQLDHFEKAVKVKKLVEQEYKKPPKGGFLSS